jgi:hypothetical protein
MSSFLFGLGSVVFNLCLTNSIHVQYIGDTLQKKETECRDACGLSLAAAEAQSSMKTKFADSKYVHTIISATKSLQK